MHIMYLGQYPFAYIQMSNKDDNVSPVDHPELYFNYDCMVRYELPPNAVYSMHFGLQRQYHMRIC